MQKPLKHVKKHCQNTSNLLQYKHPPAAKPEGTHTGTFIWRKYQTHSSTFFEKEKETMENEFVPPSDHDDSSDCEELQLFMQHNKLTAVSNPDDMPISENPVYSQLVPFRPLSTLQRKYF